MIPDTSALWQRLLFQYKKLAAATGFLSILSLPGSNRFFSDPESEAAPLLGGEYFPLVGLLLALLLGLFVLVVGPLVPQLVLAALLLVALVVLTGGLHLDGLMDSGDGLFGGQTRERKLEIMRDSRVGSFGVLAGVCSLLLKFACFASLGEHALPVVLCLVLPTARWALVLALRQFPGARAEGLGAVFRQDVTPERLLLAGAFTLIIALLAGQLAGLFVVCLVTLVTLGLGAWITRQLGGLTGDTCGAIAEIAEIVGLLACLFLHI